MSRLESSFQNYICYLVCDVSKYLFMNHLWYVEAVCQIWVFFELFVVSGLSVSHLVAFIRVLFFAESVPEHNSSRGIFSCQNFRLTEKLNSYFRLLEGRSLEGWFSPFISVFQKIVLQHCIGKLTTLITLYCKNTEQKLERK